MDFTANIHHNPARCDLTFIYSVEQNIIYWGLFISDSRNVPPRAEPPISNGGFVSVAGGTHFWQIPFVSNFAVFRLFCLSR